MKDSPTDSLRERLGGIVVLFERTHDLREVAMKLKVLEDLTQGSTSALLYDLAVMMNEFEKEIVNDGTAGDIS